LCPVSWLYQAVSIKRAQSIQPYVSSLPVLCVGNVVAGGAGKTPTVLALATLLQTMGQTPCILSRGYGGSFAGPLQVDPRHHDASQVGDEPLLLAESAPTWIARHRVAAMPQIDASGASVVLMDDGLQNPSLHKTGSLLVVDGGYGLGNERCLPAGPLREPWAAALARADAVVVIGEDRQHIAKKCVNTPVLLAALVPQLDSLDVAATRWLAFAGIGRPQKFFDTLHGAGAELAGTARFADHHPYREAELQSLAERAERANAALITTQKDHRRLPKVWQTRIQVLPVTLEFDTRSQWWLNAWLTKLCAVR
ncbi:MAG: tetraacyldisaccharide 4'-kinase, partial [Rickettsiales bacterium]|nr:tetraacyldisaccharide 4'-kinase [Rickettsiales bacterium]